MSGGALRDVAYVAARLGVSEQVVYNLVFQQHIAVGRLGSGRGGRQGHAPLRFLDADIDAFITARRAPAVDVAATAAQAPIAETVVRTVPRRRAARVLDLPGADRFVGAARRVSGGR